ncbi:MAG: hypothetical protein HY343_06895 [Lentisphaerae bacterium]|nr:hypothetical protein [Lentisphaerota bacterium]
MNDSRTMETPGAPAWHVLHSKPRCEKKLADYCLFLHVEHYLPLRKETKIYQRRKVTVWKPLFPGYLFARFNNDARRDVLGSHQVARIIPVEDEVRLLAELDQVKKVLAVDPSIGACQAVQKGTRVRVITGSFQGLEGVVSTVKGSTRVIVNVEMINRGVAVEVGLDMLERL